jgi:serine/threonine protein kinase
LVTDEGRALVAGFRAAHIVSCTTALNAIRSSALYNLRFQAPEWLNTVQSNRDANIWSFGCLCYKVTFFDLLNNASDKLNPVKVLSRKLPYYEYVEKDEVESVVSRGEPPKRPSSSDNDIDVIDDRVWELIIGCCRLKPEDRLTVPQIQKLLADLRIQDDRTDAPKLPGSAIMSLRKRPDIEWGHVKKILGQIQVFWLTTLMIFIQFLS